MAKKIALEPIKKPAGAGLFSKTEPESQADQAQERKPKPVGVYLSNDDRQELDDIAEKYNLNRHQLLQFSVQLFLKQYRAGTLRIETQQKFGRVHIKMP